MLQLQKHDSGSHVWDEAIQQQGTPPEGVTPQGGARLSRLRRRGTLTGLFSGLFPTAVPLEAEGGGVSHDGLEREGWLPAPSETPTCST